MTFSINPKAWLAVRLKRLVSRRPHVFVRLKPMTNLRHGPPKDSLRWWSIVPVVVYLGFPDGWWNYGTHYAGKRLWLYTKWGGLHFDIYAATGKTANDQAQRPGLTAGVERKETKGKPHE